MAFSTAFLEEIRVRVNIEELISKNVLLKRTGSNIVGLCPFHNEKTPSFTVFPSTESFYCFGCGAGGDAVSYIMRFEQLDYPAAVEYLARQAGIPIEESEYQQAQPRGIKKERIIEANTAAAKFFRESLCSPTGKAAMDYLTANRGFNQSIIMRFGIGCAADSWDALYKHLSTAGFNDEELQSAFLCTKSQKNGNMYDVFRNRVMFPIFDLSGDVVAFAGRRLNDADDRKYVNTSDTPAFKKSRVLFAMNFAKKSDKQNLIICEGPIDAISLHQAGFDNAIATQGTAITSEHVRQIARFVKSVLICYDVDQAGRNATEKAITLFNQIGVEVKIINLGDRAKDPDEFVKKFGAKSFSKLIDESAGQIDFHINEILSRYSLQIPEEKLRAAEELTSITASLHNNIERDIYIKRIAEKLGVGSDSLRLETEKKMKKLAAGSNRQNSKKIIEAALGYGDRVNKDRITYSTAVTLEERILGTFLARPDLAREYGNIISEDDFITEFSKKVYSLFRDDFIEGRSVSLSKNNALSPEEVNSLAKLIASRELNLKFMPDDIAGKLAALKAEKSRREFDKLIADDPAALAEYIKLKKEKV